MKNFKYWTVISIVLGGCGDDRGKQIEKCVQAGINMHTEEAKEIERRNVAEFGPNWRASPNSKDPSSTKANQSPNQPSNTESGVTSLGKIGGSAFSFLDVVKTPEYIMSSSEIEYSARIKCLEAAAGR
jgi:hypothetical protein